MNRTATAEAWLEGGLLLEYGSLSYRSRLVRGTRLREVVATTRTDPPQRERLTGQSVWNRTDV